MDPIMFCSILKTLNSWLLFIMIYSYTWASQVALVVKNLSGNTDMRYETQVRSVSREDPLEEGLATHSSILAWRIPWTEEPDGVHGVAKHQTWLKRLSMHAHNFIHLEIVPPINSSSLRIFGHFVPIVSSSVQSIRWELHKDWKNEGMEEWMSEQTWLLRCSIFCFLRGILRLTHCMCVFLCDGVHRAPLCRWISMVFTSW